MHSRTCMLRLLVLVCLHIHAQCSRVDTAAAYAHAEECVHRAGAYAGVENGKSLIPINMWKANNWACELSGGIMTTYDELWCLIENKAFILLSTPEEVKSPENVMHLMQNGMRKITKESKTFNHFKVDFIEARYDDASSVKSLFNLKELAFTQKNATCVFFGKRGSEIEPLLGKNFHSIEGTNDREGLTLLINLKSIQNFIIVYDDTPYTELVTLFQEFDELLPIGGRKDLEDKCCLHYAPCPIDAITNDFLYRNDSWVSPFTRYVMPTGLWFNREKLEQYKASENYRVLTQVHNESLAKLENRTVSNSFDMVCSILAEKMNQEIENTASKQKVIYTDLSSTEKAYKETAEKLADTWGVTYHRDIERMLIESKEGPVIAPKPVPEIGKPFNSHYCQDAITWQATIVKMLQNNAKWYYDFGTRMLHVVLGILVLILLYVFWIVVRKCIRQIPRAQNPSHAPKGRQTRRNGRT